MKSMSDYGEIDDGFGSTWALCKTGCQLEIVRPGKVQCECDNQSPYPTQAQMDAEDAQEVYRLAAYLKENHDDTRLAGEPVVDWAIRLLADHH